MWFTPAMRSSPKIQPLIHHTNKALANREVLLCWRGSISKAAFDVIDDDGRVLASGLLFGEDATPAASSQGEPLPAATVPAIPVATPATFPADVPIAVSSATQSWSAGPPVLCGEPPVVEGRERNAEMG